ncbi:peptidylprolyl isomerase, partial [Bacillus cereus]|nr:peptidylprolyl isomerase [Bacillus cereus]
ANRRLYKALKEKEYQITYEEFQGDHGSVWWREKLFEGLRAFDFTKTTLKNKKEREAMNQEELYKKLKKQEILVKDEKTAKEIKEKLNSGEDFAAVAKQYSEDPGSKEKGGELSEFGPGMMVKEFEDAAYKLEVGQLSEPVKSSFGYHIIKLTDK